MRNDYNIGTVVRLNRGGLIARHEQTQISVQLF